MAERGSRSSFAHAFPKTFDLRPSALGFHHPPLRRLGRLPSLASLFLSQVASPCRLLLPRPLDQGAQAFVRDPPIFRLRPALLHRHRQSRRLVNQLHRRRNFVDVLPARPRRPNEPLLEFIITHLLQAIRVSTLGSRPSPGCWGAFVSPRTQPLLVTVGQLAKHPPRNATSVEGIPSHLSHGNSGRAKCRSKILHALVHIETDADHGKIPAGRNPSLDENATDFPAIEQHVVGRLDRHRHLRNLFHDAPDRPRESKRKPLEGARRVRRSQEETQPDPDSCRRFPLPAELPPSGELTVREESRPLRLATFRHSQEKLVRRIGLPEDQHPPQPTRSGRLLDSIRIQVHHVSRAKSPPRLPSGSGSPPK